MSAELLSYEPGQDCGAQADHDLQDPQAGRNPTPRGESRYLCLCLASKCSSEREPASVVRNDRPRSVVCEGCPLGVGGGRDVGVGRSRHATILACSIVECRTNRDEKLDQVTSATRRCSDMSSLILTSAELVVLATMLGGLLRIRSVQVATVVLPA